LYDSGSEWQQYYSGFTLTAIKNVSKTIVPHNIKFTDVYCFSAFIDNKE